LPTYIFYHLKALKSFWVWIDDDHGAHINWEEKTVSIRKPGGGRITYQVDRYTHVEIGI
jgi:hypothetical protein